jgi:hypothetical protein
MTRLLTVLIAGTLLAGVARAQEAIPTAASGADGGAPAAAPGAPVMLSRARSGFDDRGPVTIGPCGVARDIDGVPAKPDKTPHGEVWAGVGTHGYRQAGGAVCIPVGDHAQVTLAVDAAHWGRR